MARAVVVSESTKRGPVPTYHALLGDAVATVWTAAGYKIDDAKRATGVCLYPPRAGERVPFPDGAGNLEGYEAHGGWVASAGSSWGPRSGRGSIEWTVRLGAQTERLGSALPELRRTQP